MPDVLKLARDEDHRKRDEAQFYSIQQQLDELRRQLKENLARQQWFEELYKQNEGKVSQVQVAQDRLTQDVAQTLNARQIDEARIKAQLHDLAQRVEGSDKQIRELRAQIAGLAETRKTDRDVDTESQRQVEDLYRQMREMNSHMGQLGDAQRQLRDLIHELDSAIGEVRQEALHLGELQTVEEQRLRRQGVELQGLFEALRQQFTEVAAKSQRVDDVRRQLIERIEAVEDQLGLMRTDGTSANNEMDRVEKLATGQYVLQQERLEAIRLQLESQLGEIRQMNDQRMDRIMSRFTGFDDRLRLLDQALGEIPSRFEALERNDEAIGTEADAIEEWLVARQITALESVLEDVRKRRMEHSTNINTTRKPKADVPPGSVYNPSGLIKSVRDAKPPSHEE